jgi:uncharacterized membrane protein YkvA (DUF1232 family)
MKLIKNIKQYIEHYDESELFSMLKVAGKKIGSQVVLYVLIMVTLISDSRIPMKVRIVFMAAIGYLILPTDLVADILPIIGFTDDIAFLTYVVSNASEYITPEVKDRAKVKMGKWIDNEAEDAELVEK